MLRKSKKLKSAKKVKKTKKKLQKVKRDLANHLDKRRGRWKQKINRILSDPNSSAKKLWANR